MNRKLERLLRDHGGVVHRDQALAAVVDHAIENAVRRRQVVQLVPGVYVDALHAGDDVVRHRAALLYAGPDAMLSHVTALRLWSLPVPSAHWSPVHVTVPRETYRESRGDVLVIHRSMQPFSAVMRSGLPISRLERSIVDSWPLLVGPDQRAPAILGVAERRTTARRLLDEALLRPNLKGRASLIALCDALADGCRSELELWGLRHVFDDPRFRHAKRQLPIRLVGRTVYADVAFEREKVIVELDGAAFHAAPDRREHDMRRDAALSALGWIVLRFSYQRLHGDPDGVRDEVAAVLSTRRRQLAA